MYSPYADGHSPVGFPHSEISGSRPVSGSPELIAAVHVLHRLWLPRHPPYALCSLTLSLRHASSRARDPSYESFAPLFVSSFKIATLGRSIHTIQFSTIGGGTKVTVNFVELIGIEPTTSGLQSQRSPN